MAYVNLGQVIYPVGAIFASASPTSPSSMFGGTWSQITGRFLYCNNGTGVGGSNTHTLTEKKCQNIIILSKRLLVLLMAVTACRLQIIKYLCFGKITMNGL